MTPPADPRDPARAGPPPVELVAEGLGKSFGAQVVLRGIDLAIRRGELVAIVGGSGSGKTVLLHILLGLLEPSAGRVRAADHTRPGAPLAELGAGPRDRVYDIRLSWAMVFQHNALFSDTVYENCALWLREHTELDEPEIRRRVVEALRSVRLDVDEVIDKHRSALSGGMAKRVALARALAVDPLVVFYDEPTTGLDPVNAANIHDLIWETHRRPRADGAQRTSVIVTHDRDLLRRLHPRVVMLHDAAVAFDGPYEAFAASPLPVAREYLALMPVLQGAASA